MVDTPYSHAFHALQVYGLTVHTASTFMLNLAMLRETKGQCVWMRLKRALTIEKTGGDLRGEIAARRFPERCRLGQRTRDLGFEKPRTIGFQHDGVKSDGACVEARIRADRRFAGAIENF